MKSETQSPRRGARKGRRALWLVPLIVVLAAAAYMGRGIIQRRAQATEPEPGQIVSAEMGDLSAKTTASGRLLPQREATLALSAAGRVEEVMAQVGDEVKEGDILIQLETDALQRAVRSAEQNLAIQQANLAELHQGPAEEDIAAAEAAVASARAQLDQLIVGPRDEEVATSEANLRAAQASLWGAAEQRDQIAAGPSAAEIANAEAQLVQAEMQQTAAERAHSATMRCFTDPTGKEVCPGLGAAEEQARSNLQAANKTLESAQAALDLLLAGADPNQLGAANASVAAATAQRDASQAQLDLLYVGPTEAQGASARAQLAQEEASLATLLAGASDERLAIAEAQVEQARIALEDALHAVDNASLVAPFDGVVTAVYLTAGEYAAGSSGPAIELLDRSSLQVVLDVDEVDLGAIVIGQPAVITLEAWPGEELAASVASIAPRAADNGGTVTYEVHLTLDERPTDLTLRAGMTANAELVTSERAGVLLVPNRAITADRETGTYTVNLFREGTITQVEVRIGLRDQAYTEIISGLQAGDELIIGEYKEVLSFMQGPPGAVHGIGR